VDIFQRSGKYMNLTGSGAHLVSYVEIVDSGSSTVQTPNLQITKQLFQNYTPVTDTATNLGQLPPGGQSTTKNVGSTQVKIVTAKY
jgi:hypothetical protein